MTLLLYIAIAILIIYASLALAFTSRMDGGGEPRTPEWVEKALCISPYFFLGLMLSPIAAILNLASWAGRATGHGQYFQDDLMDKVIHPDNVEFVDPLVTRVFGEDPRVTNGPYSDVKSLIEDYGFTKLRNRCLFGMALTGTMVTLIPALTTVAWGHPLIGLMIFISGPMKAFCYLSTTEKAEYLNGFQQGIAVFTAIAILAISAIMTI